MQIVARALLLLLLATQVAQAQIPSLPADARQVTDRIDRFDNYELPVAPFADGSLPVRSFEGTVEKRAWQINGYGGTTLQILDPIRTQLSEAGYELLLDCNARECGGFNFRFATDVIPAPDMYVTLNDFRFLSAVKGKDAFSVLISRTQSDAFVQTITVTPLSAVAPPPREIPDNPDTPAPSSDLVTTLKQSGHAVLSDLEFPTGSDKLTDRSYASLRDLADAMQASPGMRVAIVGHTDTVGKLNTNIALSKRRSNAVRDRLLEKYQIAAERIDAEGVGYLAPRTTNATPEGREANRRVEVVLLQP